MTTATPTFACTHDGALPDPSPRFGVDREAGGSPPSRPAQPAALGQRWPTAANGRAAAPDAAEFNGLGDHLRRCTQAHRRWFALRCAVDATGRFAIARVVSTAALLGAAVGVLVWLA